MKTFGLTICSLQIIIFHVYRQRIILQITGMLIDSLFTANNITDMKIASLWIWRGRICLCLFVVEQRI